MTCQELRKRKYDPFELVGMQVGNQTILDEARDLMGALSEIMPTPTLGGTSCPPGPGGFAPRWGWAKIGILIVNARNWLKFDEIID